VLSGTIKKRESIVPETIKKRLESYPGWSDLVRSRKKRHHYSNPNPTPWKWDRAKWEVTADAKFRRGRPIHSSIIRFLRFFENPKTRFLRFLTRHFKKT